MRDSGDKHVLPKIYYCKTTREFAQETHRFLDSHSFPVHNPFIHFYLCVLIIISSISLYLLVATVAYAWFCPLFWGLETNMTREYGELRSELGKVKEVVTNISSQVDTESQAVPQLSLLWDTLSLISLDPKSTSNRFLQQLLSYLIIDVAFQGSLIIFWFFLFFSNSLSSFREGVSPWWSLVWFDLLQKPLGYLEQNTEPMPKSNYFPKYRGRKHPKCRSE